MFICRIVSVLSHRVVSRPCRAKERVTSSQDILLDLSLGVSRDRQAEIGRIDTFLKIEQRGCHSWGPAPTDLL